MANIARVMTIENAIMRAVPYVPTANVHEVLICVGRASFGPRYLRFVGLDRTRKIEFTIVKRFMNGLLHTYMERHKLQPEILGG